MIALCLLAVGGCGQAPTHRGSDVLPAPFDGIDAVPLQQARLLHESEERAVATCMRQRGFPYLTVPPGRLAEENPYGLLTQAQAAQDGYGLTAALLAGPPPDPNAKFLAQMDEGRRTAWQNALTGSGKHERILRAPDSPEMRINTDGCVYLGRRAFYGSSWEQTELTVSGLVVRVIAGVTSDPGFRTAQQTWADCMRGRGESFTTVQEARGAIQGAASKAGSDRLALQNLSRRELQLAGRDATCQRQSALVAAVRAAQKRAEAALPDASRQQAAKLANLRKQALSSQSESMLSFRT
ncbi:hypothetical protein [Actinacidiphila paucisporea]|uniref:Uncharacterized protein n=1 Tax=Actinacidiphila paucisporea TaxID=310782 RepID=A0A1M6YNP5_9ACTN|nr:hypothetical protein [Actinacidiphila paucisporea]SHL19951.1 hypothetical protein SAMN05216499_10363 [Actinacidiphila paucisporea]